MKLNSLEYINPDYLKEIRKLLFQCEYYLKMIVHKDNLKYNPTYSDIRSLYNSRTKDNYFPNYCYPKLTTKVVKELLERNY